MTCNQCDQAATVHFAAIRDGQQVIEHLCAKCAAMEHPLYANATIQTVHLHATSKKKAEN
jgi:protein-arginine kinase activator protein McsA